MLPLVLDEFAEMDLCIHYILWLKQKVLVCMLFHIASLITLLMESIYVENIEFILDIPFKLVQKKIVHLCILKKMSCALKTLT